VDRLLVLNLPKTPSRILVGVAIVEYGRRRNPLRIVDAPALMPASVFSIVANRRRSLAYILRSAKEKRMLRGLWQFERFRQ
jgi:hypothetical protein